MLISLNRTEEEFDTKNAIHNYTEMCTWALCTASTYSELTFQTVMKLACSASRNDSFTFG